MQTEFSGNSTIAGVLPLFYEQYNLGQDGGFNDSSVKIVLYKNICFYIPNIDARRKVVLQHDIHHITTGYKSDLKGETEIAAWEIASGYEKHWVVLALDLPGMIGGFLFNMPGVFRAFVRGKRTKNLYNDTITGKEALAMTIDELREKLKLNTNIEKGATVKEVSSFVAWGTTGIIYSFLSLLFLPPIIIYSMIIGLKKKMRS